MGNGFLSFTKKTGKTFSKNLISKFNQKLLDQIKQTAANVLKTQ